MVATIRAGSTSARRRKLRHRRRSHAAHRVAAGQRAARRAPSRHRRADGRHEQPRLRRRRRGRPRRRDDPPHRRALAGAGDARATRSLSCGVTADNVLRARTAAVNTGCGNSPTTRPPSWPFVRRRWYTLSDDESLDPAYTFDYVHLTPRQWLRRRLLPPCVRCCEVGLWDCATLNSHQGHSSSRLASRPRRAGARRRVNSSAGRVGCCGGAGAHQAASPAATRPPPAVCRRRCARERRARAPARAPPHSRWDQRRRPTAVVSAAACSTSVRDDGLSSSIAGRTRTIRVGSPARGAARVR